jgi:hypothetical protein
MGCGIWDGVEIILNPRIAEADPMASQGWDLFSASLILNDMVLFLLAEN